VKEGLKDRTGHRGPVPVVFYPEFLSRPGSDDLEKPWVELALGRELSKQVDSHLRLLLQPVHLEALMVEAIDSGNGFSNDSTGPDRA
jgi:hypothetical protein